MILKSNDLAAVATVVRSAGLQKIACKQKLLHPLTMPLGVRPLLRRCYGAAGRGQEGDLEQSLRVPSFFEGMANLCALLEARTGMEAKRSEVSDFWTKVECLLTPVDSGTVSSE